MHDFVARGIGNLLNKAGFIGRIHRRKCKNCGKIYLDQYSASDILGATICPSCKFKKMAEVVGKVFKKK